MLKTIKDGELGITYQGLFGRYLEEAQWVRLVEPYLRESYQIANLERFLETVSTYPRCTQVEVVTVYSNNRQRWLRQNLNQLQQKFLEKGFIITSHFAPTEHDRWIETETHYIFLGRGLHLFYPDSSFEPLAARQRARACKIIYIPKVSIQYFKAS